MHSDWDEQDIDLDALGDLASQVQNTRSLADASRNFVDLFKTFGAEYVEITLGPNEGDVVISTLPEDWRRRAFETGLWQRSHVSRHAAASSEPICYGIDICQSNPDATPEGIELAKQAFEAFGQRTAVLFPIHDSKSDAAVGGVDLRFTLAEPEFREVMDRCGDLMQLAALVTHGQVQRLRNSEEQPDNELTPREQEVLTRISRGLRIADIARELGVAEVTVNLHLRNIRAKLGAKTLPQAVAQALAWDWLTP